MQHDATPPIRNTNNPGDEPMTWRRIALECLGVMMLVLLAFGALVFWAGE